MPTPGFGNPQAQMSSDFEKHLYQKLSEPIFGPVTGWHVFLVLLFLTLRFLVSQAMKPSKSATARHLLVSTEDECQNLKKKIENKELTFEQAAEGFSSCPSGKAGGSLGTFGPGRMVPAFDKVCFDPKTPLHQAVGPVQTHFGFHLLYIEQRTLPGKTVKND